MLYIINHPMVLMNGKMKSERAEKLMKDPKKGLFKISLPIILMMIIQTMFNITDTYFVAGLGPEAIAALTLSFPIAFFMIAFASGIGTGVTSLVSRFIGAKNKKGADNTAEHGIILSFVTAALFTTIGFVFNKQIFSFFGLAGMTFEYGTAYMNIIFLGSVFMFFTFFASSILRGEGDTATPTKLMGVSIILNIILDPLFIYFFGFEVAGAAIATVLSRVVSSVLLAYFLFIKKGSFVEFRLRDFKWNPFIIRQIMSVGLPSSFTQMSNAASLIAVNAILATFGAAAVAAFGLYIRIESLVIMPVIGISIGLITMVGMYTGSKQYGKLREVYNYTSKVNIIVMSAAAVLFFLGAEFLLRIFTSDPEVIYYGIVAIRYIVFTLPFAAIGITTSSAFQGMGKGIPALLINLLRVVILIIPLAYTLVFVFGMGTIGVWLSFVISSPVSAALAYIWFRFQKFDDKTTKAASEQRK